MHHEWNCDRIGKKIRQRGHGEPKVTLFAQNMAAWYKYHGLWVKLGFVGPGQLVQLGPLVNAGLLSNPLAFSWPPHTASELV